MNLQFGELQFTPLPHPLKMVFRSFWQGFRYITPGLIGVSYLLSPQVAQAQYVQRSFLNPSFEQDLVQNPPANTVYDPSAPINSNSPGFTTLIGRLHSNGNAGCFIQPHPQSVPYWETTHPKPTEGSPPLNYEGVSTVTQGGGNCANWVSPGATPLIELWNDRFNSVRSVQGEIFAELNAEQNSQLYQNICLIKDETITFSIYHRGRESSTTPDVASFEVDNQPYATFSTANDGSPNASALASPSPTNGTMRTAPTITTQSNGWVLYSGSFQYTGTSRVYPIGFEAISTGAPGGNITFGNFIDQAQFSGLPLIEVAAATSGGGPEEEGAPSTSPAQIRVVGLVETPLSVDVSITGGTATLGVDYEFLAGAGVDSDTVRITVPAGNYDGTSSTNSLINIPITIKEDLIPEGDETISFAIDTPVGFINGSATTCGGVAIGSSTYTIDDDEPTAAPEVLLVKRITRLNNTEFTDLENDLNSTDDDSSSGWPSGFLKGELSTTASPGDEIEYTIYFINTGRSNAQDVRICDPLSKDLEFIPNTYNPGTPTDGGLPTDRGIQLTFGSTTLTTNYLTGINDPPDRGQFVNAGVNLTGTCKIRTSDNGTPNDPADDVYVDLNAPLNLNGVVIVNVTRPSSPAVLEAVTTGVDDRYALGFIRFRARVK